MKITQTITSGDNKPDAVKIIVAGTTITVLVNMHTGTVVVEGAEGVHASEGKHNDLELEVCPAQPAGLSDLIATGVDFAATLGRVTQGGPLRPSMGFLSIFDDASKMRNY